MRDEDMAAPGAELVSSGAFKVDRARALDKLMRFQLPEAGMFVLPLLRCAVGSGATRVQIKTGRGRGLGSSRFEMRFDGRPLTLEELSDPYSVLFNKRAPETSRNRELAVALLTGLRIKQDLLSVTSGSGNARVRLEVESLRSEKARPVQDAGTETVFELQRGELMGSFDDVTAIVRRSCRACRISVLVDGREAANIPGFDPETTVYFDGKDTRGWLTVPRIPLETSTIRAFTYGIEVGSFDHGLPRVQVEGFVNDDGFALNVSQTGVARSGRFKAAMSAVAEQSEKLVLKVLDGSGERLAKAADLIKKKGTGPWTSGLDRTSAGVGPGLLALLSKAVRSISADGDRDRDALESMGAVTAWLLEACLRNLHDPAKDAKTPVLKALWEGPLLLSVKGEPLSLRDLAALRARMGFVPYSRRLEPDYHPFPAVWSSSERVKRLLEKLFSDSLKDMTSAGWTLQVAATLPGGTVIKEVSSSGSMTKVEVRASFTAQADVRVLDRMGLGDILIRDSFVFEDIVVEVAIPASMERDSARIYFWEEAGPRLLDMAPRVKFTAAMLRPSALAPVTDADLGRAVAASADFAAGLYRRLSHEYDCWKTDSRTAAIRRALLDFLAAALSGFAGPALPEPLAWLEEVSLFRTGSGWADFRHFRAGFDEGKALCVALSLHAVGALRPERSIIGSEYSEKLIESILPGSGSLPVNGDLGARLWFKKTPLVGCGHKSQYGCLVSIASPDVHLALGEIEGGSVLHLPWGTVAAIGADSSRPDLAAKLAGRLDLAAAMALAVIESVGTGWNCPGHSARKFLLKAVTRLFAPWPGRPVPGGSSRLKDLLGLLPFFQTSTPVGISLADMAALLASCRDVTFLLRRPGSEPPFAADLILDKAELEVIRHLWPIRSEKLVNVGGPDRSEQPAAEESRPDAAPAPVRAAAPEAPLSVPAPLHLMPDEKMLFERRYEEPGLRGLIGLPERWKDGLKLVVRKASGEAAMTLSPKGLPLVGTAILDTSVAPDPDLVPEEDAVLALFARFYADLLDAWPLGGPGDPRHRCGVRYLLKILELHGFPEKRPEGPWGALLSRIWSLRMLPALGMELVSLELLAARASGKGHLPYAVKAFYLRDPEAAWVPVLGKFEQLAVSRLVCKRLGVKFRPYQPEPEPVGPASPEERPTAAVEGAAEEEPTSLPLVVLRRLLKRIRGLRGVKVLPSFPVWRDDEGLELALLGDPRKIGINRGHPMVRAVSGSGLDEARQAYYLASMVFTAANRSLGNVTDLDDIRFHESLADVLASPGSGTPAAAPPKENLAPAAA